MSRRVAVHISDINQHWICMDLRRSEQHYLSRTWDYEEAERFIISDGRRVVEASVFRHYLAKRPVKTVVELPTSFGCQMSCPHCASGDIGAVLPLSHSDLRGVYDVVSRSIEGPRLVSFAGIGECSLNEKSVLGFARELRAEDTDVRFTLTTVGVRPEFIGNVDRLAGEGGVKLLQISLFHNQNEAIRYWMGAAFVRYDLQELLRRVRAVEFVHIRFNIVLMRDFNDAPEVWSNLADLLDGLQTKLSIRVSQLNETNVSRANGILPTSREQVLAGAEYFCSRDFDAYPFMSSFNDDMNCGQLVWNYRKSRRVIAA